MSLSVTGLRQLLNRLERATRGEFNEDLALWLEALGMEFLDLVHDEIIRTETVLTRRLLNSFDRGDGDNIFEIRDGGLVLEIGTNVEYASWVNDGHWTTPEGVEQRFVPGRWTSRGARGDAVFEYDPNARDENGHRTGMVLRRKWVEGKHYWDNAMAIWERIFDRSLEVKLQQWLDELGGV